jgi:hypothetical protein
MPEFKESLAHFLLLFYLYHKYKTNWTLLNLWADFSDAEVKHLRKGQDGLVQCLDHTCAIKRGSKSHQTAIYPQRCRQTRPGKPPQELQSLQLVGLDRSPRAIFLIFNNELRLKVSAFYFYNVPTSSTLTLARLSNAYFGSSIYS